jgi:hypothetical protein
MDNRGIDNLTTFVNSLNSRLEGDHLRKIDPIDTWNSVMAEHDQHKALFQANPATTTLEHAMMGLIGNLIRMVVLSFESSVTHKDVSTGEKLPTADPAADPGLVPERHRPIRIDGDFVQAPEPPSP